jgi:hypothetical protein
MKKRPLPPKFTPLIEVDVRFTEVVKYYYMYIVPWKRGHSSYKATPTKVHSSYQDIFQIH